MGFMELTANEHRDSHSTIPQIQNQTLIKREILMKSILKGK